MMQSDESQEQQLAPPSEVWGRLSPEQRAVVTRQLVLIASAYAYDQTESRAHDRVPEVPPHDRQAQ